ncbi:hypothetical protein B0T21DRAFT_366277 [Apiosordaria backusii]|uniref:Secreted protein n=1 Tax=Apiosordaria backusii TaxID=314023 RepID=A0AA40EF44_9PEZI|nr:hypothetical protein B0T21DRAFT_366277 [Apiosordaria backusii]
MAPGTRIWTLFPLPVFVLMLDTKGEMLRVPQLNHLNHVLSSKRTHGSRITNDDDESEGASDARWTPGPASLPEVTLPDHSPAPYWAPQ